MSMMKMELILTQFREAKIITKPINNGSLRSRGLKMKKKIRTLTHILTLIIATVRMIKKIKMFLSNKIFNPIQNKSNPKHRYLSILIKIQMNR